jgi:penicillin amidase
MRTRTLRAFVLLVACLIVCISACSGSSSGGGTTSGDGPLTLTTSSDSTADGPVTITATPDSIAADVAWTLDGAGAIAEIKGAQTHYKAPIPASVPGASVTVTAKVGTQTASVKITASPMALTAAKIPGLTAPVNVTFDAQDVPHVFCAAMNDCLAVQGYLQARDRFFQMDFFRRVARGRLASLIGQPGVSQDQQLLTIFVTRDGKRIEDALYAVADAETKGWLTSYAAGVNAYLGTLTSASQLPGEYAKLPPVKPADIPRWEPQDTLAIARLQQFQLSETLSQELDYGTFASAYGVGGLKADPGKYNAWVRPEQPLAGYTLGDDTKIGMRPPPPPHGMSAPMMNLAPWLAPMAEARKNFEAVRPIFGRILDGAGSNNWVVDAAHSQTGKAMVANDPHLSLNYPPLFHLISMTASDSSGLDITGGSFAGIPGALVGRGKHVGWGVTVVGYDVTDVYLETLVCDKPMGMLLCPQVLYKGQAVSFLNVPSALTYQIQIAGSNVPFPWTVLVVPHHGPIISYDPMNGTAMSVRWTGHEVTPQDLRAFLGLNTATSVGDATLPKGSAFAALENYAVGAQNFVLADDQGNIGYDPHARVPKRPWAGAGPGRMPWMPLDGSSGNAEWGTGNDADNCAGSGATKAAASCWIPDNQLPTACGSGCTVNTKAAGFKGYLATANSDPGGYGDTSDPTTGLPTGVPGAPYLSFTWDDPTDMRYSRIAQLLKTSTANGGKVSVDGMMKIQSDHQSLLGKVFEGLYPALGTAPASYTSARTILGAWKTGGYDCPTALADADPNGAASADATVLSSSAGCLLFHQFLRTLLGNVFVDDLGAIKGIANATIGINGAAEVNAMLYMLSLNPLDAGTPALTTFCNDVDSKGVMTAAHTCQEQVVTALAAAYDTVSAALGTDTKKWIWGRVHTASTTSPYATLVAPFASGPFARPGGAFTVDVGSPSLQKNTKLDFSYGHGSNVRHVSLMSTDASANVCKMQLPGAEKDGPWTKGQAPDLVGQYMMNKYFDFLIGTAVNQSAYSTETFSAQ